MRIIKINKKEQFNKIAQQIDNKKEKEDKKTYTVRSMLQDISKWEAFISNDDNKTV